jgi:hypothetical protein
MPRLGQAATLLSDGKVPISGGNGEMNQAVEVYDPSAGRPESSASLSARQTSCCR